MSLAQDIESRVNIFDVVSRYVNLKKAGVNYKWLCPFHSERTPSFIVSPQKNIAHCFSCGKWGGPIRFLMEVEKVEFREAVSILAKEAGIELQTDYGKEKSEKWEDIYALYREVASFYHHALFEKENEKYLKYLTDREISRDTIAKFSLGCSTNSRDLLYHLKNKWFDHKFLMESGIFLSETRDKFFGRITFPIANSMGHIVAFTGRVLDTSLPKYLNSPASHIFDKSSILYGMHLAKQKIAKTEEVYIVEWQMDTIALHQVGIENAVGISGTALTAEHIRILKRSTKIIYLALDADNAWVKATFASIENILNQDLEVRIIHIPNGKDPDEFIKSGGNFDLLREEAMTPIAFYLAEWGREYDLSTIIGKKKLIEKCLEFLLPIRSQIEISLHISEISTALGVSQEAIYAEYKKKVQYSRTSKKSEDGTWNESSENPENIQKPISSEDYLAGYILNYNLFDLFFHEFRYTPEDLFFERDFSLLKKVIGKTPLDSEDEEILKVIALHLENIHPDEDASATSVQKAFLDAIKSLHKRLLRHEFQKAKSEHPEALGTLFIEFLEKAKKILPGEPNIQTLFRS